MTENVTTQTNNRFGTGALMGVVVFLFTWIFSLLIDSPLYFHVAIIGFVSGLIRHYVKDWPEIISFAGGHFLLQWVFYSVTKTADWKVSLAYALIGMVTCLVGQWALALKKS